MIVEEEEYLAHYGILRKSGRYPWGSGDDAATRSRDFYTTIAVMKKKGMTEPEIMKSFEMNTSEWRAAKSIARNEKLAADRAMVERFREKGMSNVAIGKRMGIPESSVRAMLAPGQKHKMDVLKATTDMLKEQVAKKQFVDVGSGVEHHIPFGITNTKLGTALAALKQEGYTVEKVQVDQLGTNQKTTIRVLAPPGTTYLDIKRNISQIKQVTDYTTDGGISYTHILPPKSISSKRVGIRYGKEGGEEADGVIYVRPGVKDVSLGASRYAQVRIAVDNTHYLKGMALYKDDLPEGVDLMFHTNKDPTGNKLDAMKPLKRDKETGEIDKELPFGSVINRQVVKDHGNGKKELTSVMNIVNDEDTWEKWSRTLSSQFLSKQSPQLAQGQLSMSLDRKKNELENIMKLTNPAVRKRLLEDFAEGADSSAQHLKAAALPDQKTHVILPMNSMKPSEVYAPNYANGTRVTLVRFPHGGIFEIPELVVNNKNPEAKKLLGAAPNAIGIHHKVAQKLSGADFDGDTVLVIPNNSGRIKHAPSLEGLKNFDPRSRYPGYEGMKRMTPQEKGTQMGLVSNLITDMTIKRASTDELARAVRHSMVVIDAEKHGLNWKQSSIDNNIPQLMGKYQKRSTGGASTLISSKRSTLIIPERKRGYRIDPETGKKIYTYTGAQRVDAKGKVFNVTQRSTKLAETDDAHTLSSGTLIEKVYANYSNSMKALANQARRASVHIKTTPYSEAARKAYASEVASLDAKLTVALKNAPLERQAQIIANAKVKLKRDANPDLEPADLKKIKGIELTNARLVTGAGKQRVEITDREWEAIQAGAITNNKLEKILDNANLDRVKQLATPRSVSLLTAASKARAQTMIQQGYTFAEVASALGVSTTTLHKNLG